MIQFAIPGAPVAKGRPRARIIQKRGQKPMPQIYTPEETRAEEARLREYVCLQLRAMLPRRPLAGPLRLEIVFVLQPPQRLDKERSKRWPHVGADVDNFVKLFSDAMNGIIYEDDSQICAISAIKVYGAVARTEVRISQLSDADEAQHSLWGGIE